MAELGAILTAMVTPFDKEGRVNMDSAAKLMRHLVDHGSDGLVVCATTGESPTLSDGEKLALFELAMTTVGERATVIAGTGSNDTAHSVDLTRRAGELGVDGMLVVSPYYNKPPETGVEEHYKSVAASTDKQIILYNIPGRSVINLSPKLLERLGQIENITAVKQAVGDMDQAREILASTDLALYAGDDKLLEPFLELGGSGGVCTSSQVVGEQMQAIVQAVNAGDLERARQLADELEDVFQTLFITSNPIPVKAALNILGFEVGGLRLPLVSATDEETEQIRAMLERHGLAKTAAT